MKAYNTPILLLLLMGGVILLVLNASQDKTYVVDVNSTTKKYPIKSYHKAIQLECKNCHGDMPKEDYEELEDEQCISCHKSKEYLAKRLSFMEKDETSPHNSYHDGTNLSCYECHRSHEESINMCADCHNVETWMKPIK